MENVMVYVARKGNLDVIAKGLSCYNSMSTNVRVPKTIDELVNVFLDHQAHSNLEKDLIPVSWDVLDSPARNCSYPQTKGKAAYVAGRRFSSDGKGGWEATVQFKDIDKAEVKEQPKLRTVFSKTGFFAGQGRGIGSDRGTTIQDLIDYAIKQGHVPTYWAEEATIGYEGTKANATLRNESRDAGRVIERMSDGTYRQRFSDGSVTKNVDVKVVAVDPNAAMIARDGPAKPKKAVPMMTACAEVPAENTCAGLLMVGSFGRFN